MTNYIKSFKKIIKNENIQKLFLQGKSNGFVVLKSFFKTIMFRNVAEKKKVNLGIFPFFGAKYAQIGGGSAKLHIFQVTYLIFLISEKEVDKISY